MLEGTSILYKDVTNAPRDTAGPAVRLRPLTMGCRNLKMMMSAFEIDVEKVKFENPNFKSLSGLVIDYGNQIHYNC